MELSQKTAKHLSIVGRKFLKGTNRAWKSSKKKKKKKKIKKKKREKKNQ